MFRFAMVSALLIGAHTASAAVVDVAITSNAFNPAQITVRVGDTVRWTLPASDPGSGYGGGTPGVPHNVAADNGSFRSGDPEAGPWQFSETFRSAGDYPYYCERHGAPGRIGMSGIVSVQAATLQINEGLAGVWVNPATTGQGFVFDVHPSSHLIGLGWFTWSDQAGVYDWLSGVGTFAGASAEVLLTRTRGGQFNAPLAVTNDDAGTATITFSDCAHARIAFSLTSPSRSGTIDLVKLLPTSPLCTSPAVPDAQAD